MEKLDLIVVKTISKGTRGSAILYLPPQQTEIVYAITAKHCVFGKRFDNGAQPIDIQLVWNDGKIYPLNAAAKIHCFAANEPDIALLELPYAAIRACVGDLPLIRLSAWDQTIEKGSFKGFPNATDAKENNKARTIKNLEILHNDSKNFLFYMNTTQKLGSDDDSTINAVSGFSGSGVWAEPSYDNSLYLLGVVTDVEDWNNRFEGVKIAVIQDLIPTISTFRTPRQDEYRALLHTASADLRRWKNHFGDYPESHIARTETQQLLNWVENPLQDKCTNIALLTGGGGYGKTNVLRDLWLVLDPKMPVLAIKADNRTEKRLTDLAQQLFKQSKDSIETVLNYLLHYHEKVVLLIDQLDALSQTLSTERAFLQTYDDLIQQFVDNQRVRIVMSIRKFDADNDARLGAYKKGAYEVEMQPLDASTVQAFLRQIGIAQPSTKLVSLLCIPNHLDIFCRLSDHHKANWDSLSSIGDLYKALWETLHKDMDLLNKADWKIEALMFEMANKMDAKRLYLKMLPFKNKFRHELAYLQSKTIILENDDKIQFFHQTFYEYAYARHFVAVGKSLSQELERKGQNLYVRSQIKLILEYLRDYDEASFVETVKDLMEGGKYRFHIKLLVINILGSLKNPDALEIEMVEQIILSNEKYARLFMDSVFSGGWLAFLREKGVINDYLTTSDAVQLESNVNLILRLLRRNVQTNLDEVLNCLDCLPDFGGKVLFITNILFFVDNWESKRFLYYFEKYLLSQLMETHEFTYQLFKTIKIILAHHKKDAFRFMKLYIIDFFKLRIQSNNTEHYVRKIIQKMYDLYPQDTFAFLFDTVQELTTKRLCSNKNFYTSDYISLSWFSKYDSQNTELVRDSEFSFRAYLFELLSNHIKSLNENEFNIFCEQHKKSNSIVILEFLMLRFLSSMNHANQFVEMLTSINERKGLEIEHLDFKLKLQACIKQYFPILNKIQQTQLKTMILNIDKKVKLHKFEYGDTKHVSFDNNDILKYFYIKQLPISDVEADTLLKRMDEELKRKLPRYEPSSHRPAPPTNYSKMNFKNWEQLMLKLNDNYKSIGFHNKKDELTAAFYKHIIDDIEKFSPFIEKIIFEKKVSTIYMAAGLQALITSKYDSKEIVKLYKSYINCKPQLVSPIYDIGDYLIENKLVDEIILNHWVDLTLNYDEEPSKSFHTVRGAAIKQVLNCTENSNFEKIIFETVEKTTNDKQVAVRMYIMLGLPHLNYWDKERAFRIFNRLITHTSEDDILERSIGVAGDYRFDYFNQMNCYFEKMITMEKPPRSIGELIFYCWCEKYEGSNDLLEKYINKNNISIVDLLSAAENHLWENGVFAPYSLALFERFLTYESKQIASAYAGMILRKFKKVDQFEVGYDFFLKYAASKLCTLDCGYFLKYLILCSKYYPKKCLDLIEKIRFEGIPDIRSHAYFQDEPLQAILAIYSALEQTADKAAIQKALDIFDGMLENEYLSLQANRALETLPTQRALALLD